MEPVGVGAFSLIRPLGRGGMGQVWEAVHTPSGERVALKALAGAPSAAALRAFRTEVEAVAAMSHDAIVLLYDHGVLPEAAARSVGLEPGAPWLAMQLCSLGSLQPSERWPTGWAETRQLLLTVLSALAHAHARDVIHRDLKPGNLLLGAARDVRPGICVADFGLARLGAADPAVRLAGTPAYLPPEQLGGRNRDVGPWTDLYALGCVAWELITGFPPFDATDPRSAAQAHRTAELPRLEPRVAVPADVEAWLASLLEKRPSQRPASAAQAAWMLGQLGGTPLEPRPASSSRAAASGTFSFSLAWEAPERPPPARPEVPRPPSPLRPFPRDWPRDPPPLSPHLLHGAGDALLGLRPLPFVGRLPEREALWEALARTVGEGAQRVALIGGPPGVGRSYLVHWLAVTARELDAAAVLETSGSTGLAPALGRALGLEGLDEAERREVIAAGHRPDLVHALLRGAPASEAAPLLLDLAGDRPLLVIVDDAAPDLVRLAARALQLRPLRAAPLLLALVVNDPPAAESEPLLRDLDGHPAVERISVVALSHHRRLAVLRQALGLHPSLADRIAEEAGGSPGDATSLVVDLSRRGLLRPGSAGFELAPGLELRAAAAVRADQADQLLAASAPRHFPALALAALLGTRAPAAWWEAACAEAGVAPDAAGFEPWVRAGLLRRHGGEHRFVGEARARIVDEARRDPRFVPWSEACARACERHAAEPGALLAAGQLRLEAGDPLGAVDLFARQLEGYRREESPYERTARVLELWNEALRRAGVAEHDPRWSSYLGARAAALTNAGRVREALAACEEHLERVARHGWSTRAYVLSKAGQIARRARERDKALAWLEQALAESPEPELGLLRDLGVLARMDGDLQRAADYARRCLAVAEAAGDLHGASAAHNDLGAVFDDLGRPAEARACFERSLAICEAHRVGEPLIVRLNILSLDMTAGAPPEEVLARAQALLAGAEASLAIVPMAATGVLVLEAAARAEDWPAFDRAAAGLHALFDVLVSLSTDVVVHLLRTALLARAAGQEHRAAAVESQAHRLEAARSERGRTGQRATPGAGQGGVDPAGR